jgi:hypothetical protein
MDIVELRKLCVATLDDCGGPACDKLRLRLKHTRDAREIWMARSEIYQMVAHQHCQSQAATRINSLLPAFEGWVPSRMLAAV